MKNRGNVRNVREALNNSVMVFRTQIVKIRKAKQHTKIVC